MSESAVTAEEFVRYFNTRLADFKCEVCGTDQFSLELDPRLGAGPMFIEDAMSEDGTSRHRSFNRIPTCIISCKSCGNTKMFLRRTVEKWLEEHPRG